MKLRLQIFSIVFCLMTTVACSEDSENFKNYKGEKLHNASDSDWQKLSKTKILFGHHSVGRNILEGVKLLMKEHDQINLKIVDMESETSAEDGYLKHFKVGQNKSPLSKTTSFKQVVSEEAAHALPHLAFFKFCYVDIDENTDVDKLFENYKETFRSLKEAHPELSLMHVTVPLRTTDLKFNMGMWFKRLTSTTYWRAIIERFFNISKIFRYKGNVKRNRMNQLIVENYEGIDPIFDLAKFQATFPDGSLNTFTRKGKEYLSLIPEYSTDGGHLNDRGKKLLAERFLFVLLSFANDKE